MTYPIDDERGLPDPDTWDLPWRLHREDCRAETGGGLPETPWRDQEDGE